ncbi:hypothetical protein A3B60_01025 [Candidatus Peregrinibacteria bacterium RIFCSPLOWO2_01_FULL_39_12]|nr:MAG: hypothetical protein A3I58_02835 [Candidatus Peregrinibacteria bacterium RIFCSPLOWO2_02_FULL_39_10]OGJ43049.1 MAG: hypothetical protein A3B60_01025 [Candidatus Peregrinibacteria bacterium RIFCSPLOWO2_01_FULL_39_12]
MIRQTQLQTIFKKFKDIKLAYLFGSQAKGNAGKLSDYDFAVYLDEQEANSKNSLIKRTDIKLELMAKLQSALKAEKIDIVILNDTDQPELKYHIIQDGKLIYQEEPYRIIIEPKILNEYFDFRHTLRQYGLTKA